MMSEDRLYWLWLAQKCGVASKEFARLIARFENPFEIFRLEPEEIGAIDCISDRLKDRLSEKSLEASYSLLKYCSKNKIEIIAYSDKKYPSRLKTLEDPPAVLYCMGELPDLNRLICIGVVGTRKISAYGMHSAYKISYELASAGTCVVSGMALGIDAVAACAAIEAGGTTVAVLGCGIDVVYPKEHGKLQREICKHGAVVTEYPPSEAPYGKNFPKRNRIISGLCQGVLVVEGNRSSGAMITANRAIAQGREVFALPGNIDESNSEGPNYLLQEGVNVALSAEDILCHYEFMYQDVINYSGWLRGRKHSQFSASALKKRGVSDRVRYGGAKNEDVGDADAVNAEETARVVNAAKTEKSSCVKREISVSANSEEDNGERRGNDNSAEILASLDPVTQKVFDAMPIDRAVTADEFISQGIGISEAITSLTMLEINGLVSSLPGGTYVRK